MKNGSHKALHIDTSSDFSASATPGSLLSGKHDDDGSDTCSTSCTDTPGSPANMVEGVLVSQPEDGSCLFHSIAFGIGDGCDAKTLRRDIAEFIATKSKSSVAGEPIEEWISMSAGTSPRTYAKDLLQPYTWGSALEIAVAAKIKRVNINVYQSCSSGKFKLTTEFTEPSAAGTVDVVYRTTPSKHYDALCHKR